MKRRTLVRVTVILTILVFAAAAVLAGAPYGWPKDTGGDISRRGEDANGWDYYVDFYAGMEHWIAPMQWCEAEQRWEDPEHLCNPGGGYIERDGDRWRIVGGDDPTLVANPKICLHPDINGDLDGAERKRFRAGVNMKALPGGASLRIFLCDSGEGGGPDPDSNRRDLFGTADEPIIYGPNEPIQGSWRVTIGEEGSGADMTHCDWLVFEVDDPDAIDETEGGQITPPEETDDDDDVTDDDDDITDDDDDIGDDDDDDDNFEWVFDQCPLFSEMVAFARDGQFIEIYNPTADEMDLSDVYVSNSPLYYGMVKQDGSVDTNSGANGYFNAKFPDNAKVPPMDYAVVAIGTSAPFESTYGFAPDYVLHDTKAAAAMEDAFPGSIKGQGDLSKDGEALMLYKWDGRNDLVCDCDYVIWGDGTGLVDKTGVAIDGIDADAVESGYNDDTAAADQMFVANTAHADGESFNRCDLSEGTEEHTGDNNGCDPDTHDETSENLDTTWDTLNPPTPGDDASCLGDDDDDDDDDNDDDDNDDDNDDDDNDDDDEGCGC